MILLIIHIIHSIRKSEAINLLENSVLEDRGYIRNLARLLAWYIKFEKRKALKKELKVYLDNCAHNTGNK